ncbi:MAG TPA: FAD-dependent monooxygenase [Bdellovibrionota bacterium]|nr:FAD-dependent monooxygenase [Bdellovibrionota bacterium]
MKETQVLIAGAGPTRLVLALALTRQGIRVRIIDKTPGPGTTSRALVVHARTLELYRMLGLAQEFQDRGLPFTEASYWIAGKWAGRLVLGDIGKDLSPFPYLLISPQDQHERILIEHLSKAGVEVERQTELVAFEGSPAPRHALVGLARSCGVSAKRRVRHPA